MTRAQYVQICKTCKKRDFNSSKGVVCSLTQEHANYAGKCPDFLIDEKLVKKYNDQKAYMEAQEEHVSKRNVGLDIGLGLLFLIGGIVLTVSDVGYIFYGAILYGIYRLTIGIMDALR